MNMRSPQPRARRHGGGREASRRALVLSLLFALLAAAAPSGAAAFSKAIWGDVYRGGVSQFPIYRQLGVSIYETKLPWFQVAPRRPRHPLRPHDPAYRWPLELDQAVAQARRYHMRVLVQIIGSPSWANGGKPWNWAPRRSSDFAAFATAAARRYPGIHLWVIWGEPDRHQNFEPMYTATPGTALNAKQKVAPHNYARLLDAAYGALKAVSPHNIVIGGCTFTSGDISPQQWIANLRLPNGRPPRMDMYAHNPFTLKAPDFSDPPSPEGEVQFSDLPRLARWIDRYLRRGMPIFLSEWTVPTAPDQEFGFYADPPVAAGWIRQALRLSRQWRRIYGLGWIHVYDDPPLSYGGLMEENGKKKPLFWAFAG